ncbi:DUF2239 family protein [Pyxidicoccus xibeiensis]|uniref:DUF2239 family protein n=1 Tax=Pyxidicoccus xibeiensis TaxID=2906759 RepID=UPI0020A70F6D|nr:DUF2239 family protein [Pyxidicoccus xibeiensis]MCP3145058.1 DUF2239 family protein [Pyxidicoccus xibeiensis]
MGDDTRWGDGQAGYTAFAGPRCIASGGLEDVALKAKAWVDGGETVPVVIYEDATGYSVHPDLRGSREDVLRGLAERRARTATAGEEPRRSGPGRPKLGVVSREVSLLPRHWEWLNAQPSGASAALRRLVEEAQRNDKGRERARRSQEAASTFMHAVAGDLPGLEEASRAFYAKNPERFAQLIEQWPDDIRNHVHRLVSVALRDEAEATRSPTERG